VTGKTGLSCVLWLTVSSSGITRCDMIAESIIGAAGQLGPFPVPVVVRLQGTNSEKGLQLLKEADLGLHVEADFGKAAERVVELANSR
jgi:succinyl-CoA synthetase beta subunit